jgi:ATP-dependent DNA helicase RecG
MPENQQSEWKSTWQDRHLEGGCAFANANGGVLEFGKTTKARSSGCRIVDSNHLKGELMK